MPSTPARSARHRVTLRGAYDRFTSNGDLPVRGCDLRPAGCRRPATTWSGSWWTAGGRLTRPLPGADADRRAPSSSTTFIRTRLPAIGAEPTADVRQRARRRRSAVFVQDEIKLGDSRDRQRRAALRRLRGVRPRHAACGADRHAVRAPVVQVPVRQCIPCAEYLRAESTSTSASGVNDCCGPNRSTRTNWCGSATPTTGCARRSRPTGTRRTTDHAEAPTIRDASSASRTSTRARSAPRASSSKRRCGCGAALKAI